MKYLGRKKLSNRAGIGVSLAAVPALAAACGSSKDSGSSSASSASTPDAGTGSSSSDTTLTTHCGYMGTYVTDSAGNTLYLFASDRPTKSTCSGSCAAAWPLLTVTSTPTASPDITGKLGTIKGAGGVMQVTLNGHPLYKFSGDSAPGQTNGEGLNEFGAAWLMLTPAGQQIDKGVSSSFSPAGRRLAVSPTPAGLTGGAVMGSLARPAARRRYGPVDRTWASLSVVADAQGSAAHVGDRASKVSGGRYSPPHFERCDY